jgi:hypothetical protein
MPLVWVPICTNPEHYTHLAAAGAVRQYRAVSVSMFEFSQQGPNHISSSTGHTIEILGRAGLRVNLGDAMIEIDSEMLQPPMSIAIYSASIPDASPTPAAEIPDEVIKGLEWAGFSVEVI